MRELHEDNDLLAEELRAQQERVEQLTGSERQLQTEAESLRTQLRQVQLENDILVQVSRAGASSEKNADVTEKVSQLQQENQEKEEKVRKYSLPIRTSTAILLYPGTVRADCRPHPPARRGSCATRSGNGGRAGALTAGSRQTAGRQRRVQGRTGAIQGHDRRPEGGQRKQGANTTVHVAWCVHFSCNYSTYP